MIHNNIINGYEYRKYRQKVNNKVTTLPNIFIQGGQMIMDKNKKEDKDKSKNKKEDIKNTKNTSTEPSENNINNVFKNIREETIHFGDTVKDDSEFISNDKSQISNLPQLPQFNNLEEAKMDNIEQKSEDWVSVNEEDKENKKVNSNSKKSGDKKTNSDNKTNENNEEKKIEEINGNDKNEKDEDKENKEEGEGEKNNEEKEKNEKDEKEATIKEGELLDIYKDDDDSD